MTEIKLDFFACFKPAEGFESREAQAIASILILRNCIGANLNNLFEQCCPLILKQFFSLIITKPATAVGLNKLIIFDTFADDCAELTGIFTSTLFNTYDFKANFDEGFLF